jgi:hypothetical protein
MSSPFAPLNPGDLNDDDAQVIGDLVTTETLVEPEFGSVQSPIYVRTLQEPKRATRTLTGQLSVQFGWTTPTLLLPEDLHRVTVVVQVYSPTAQVTDGIQLFSDSSGYTMSGFLAHGGQLELRDHTGPLYAYPATVTGAGASRNVLVSWWAVTK